VALLNCKLILYPLALVGIGLVCPGAHLKVHLATLVVLSIPPDTRDKAPVCPETQLLEKAKNRNMIKNLNLCVCVCVTQIVPKFKIFHKKRMFEMIKKNV
jgi:hypothetical protein